MLSIGLDAKLATVLMPVFCGIITGLVSYAQVSTQAEPADVTRTCGRLLAGVHSPLSFSLN